MVREGSEECENSTVGWRRGWGKLEVKGRHGRYSMSMRSKKSNSLVSRISIT